MAFTTIDMGELPDPIPCCEKIWREYSLAMIFPRSAPEWIDDSVIRAKLYECRDNEWLPWDIDEANLTWIETR
jgi:hypothetical protein